MQVKNSLAKKENGTPTFAQYVKNSKVVSNIYKTLGSEMRGKKFVTSIISAVNSNPELQTCDFATTVSAGLIGESLNLSPSPQLGHYYMVPFNDRKNNRRVSTFQLGYKGYIQLAIRSGQYKRINVVSVKEGELINYDPFNEEIEVTPIQDEREREKAETIGYYAMFELVNGFRKTMYWSKEKMEEHAMKYSQGYRAKKGYTFWEKDFDGMAYKTMLRQLISKWGIMSIEMQNAYENDMSYKESEEQAPVYFDNEKVVETEINEVPDETPKHHQQDVTEPQFEPDRQAEPVMNNESLV